MGQQRPGASGLSFDRDRVLQVAVVTVDGEGRVVERWSSLVRPRSRWFFWLGPRHIHGLTRARLRAAPPATDVLTELTRRLDARIAASGLSSYNGFGMIATEAAWRTGDAWLDALLPYLTANRDILDKRIEAAAPGARSMRLDSTYLAWVDFAGTGLKPDDVATRVAKQARIFASPGPQFGPGGESWLRFNFATPRPILEDALGRLDDAFKELRQ